jgi:hypothetical protein
MTMDSWLALPMMRCIRFMRLVAMGSLSSGGQIVLALIWGRVSMAGLLLGSMIKEEEGVSEELTGKADD